MRSLPVTSSRTAFPLQTVRRQKEASTPETSERAAGLPWSYFLSVTKTKGTASFSTSDCFPSIKMAATTICIAMYCMLAL